MTEEIKQIEKGALEFAKSIFGDALADAIYLGTYGGIGYYGPIFYEEDATIPSLLITYCKGEYNFLPIEKLKLDSYEDIKEFERRQLNWWDNIAVIQCAYKRGKREGLAHKKKALGITTDIIS